MSAPILFGTSTSEKGYTTPKTIGLNSRSAGFGFGQRSVVDRAPVIPPPPPPIAAGYNAFWGVGDGTNTAGPFGGANIEQYNFANDTTVAYSLNGAPATILAPDQPTWEAGMTTQFLRTYGGSYNGRGSSYTHAFTLMTNNTEFNVPSSPFDNKLANVFFFPYANGTEQNNLNEMDPNVKAQYSMTSSYKDGGKIYSVGGSRSTAWTHSTVTGNFANVWPGGISPPANFITEGLSPPLPGVYNTIKIREGNSVDSLTHGFFFGGREASGGGPVAALKSGVRKLSYANDLAGEELTSLDNENTFAPAGRGSSTFGYSIGSSYYSSGGPLVVASRVHKFPFSSPSISNSLILDLAPIAFGRWTAGGSSATFAYNGYGSPSTSPSGPIGAEIVHKFPFASDTDVSETGTLTYAKRSSTGNQES
jgi:hypothetical protein